MVTKVNCDELNARLKVKPCHFMFWFVFFGLDMPASFFFFRLKWISGIDLYILINFMDSDVNDHISFSGPKIYKTRTNNL
jgi:hypothetical protein